MTNATIWDYNMVANILKKRGEFMSCENIGREVKFMVVPGETCLRNHEIWTLKSDVSFISIWPGDYIRITLRNEKIYEGEAVWSIEPWRIAVQYENNISAAVDVESMKSVEILRYSDLRPTNERREIANDERYK